LKVQSVTDVPVRPVGKVEKITGQLDDRIGGFSAA
jgi:hypothetical protein